ncbi:M1 family metallopeptidase [Cognatiluteimonas weifangensis]|uniref:M1 family peptidase n=1 Tax=Cognatiluteimonas weifangensis TaxID=2303539 RepID=A0A372DIN6_9GAMM|nr:M1 family metallopeptidase [Luteimonas weifangensis]RFP59441.1 M1 family peptidase [Luteimonas weifangensis]
MLHLRILLAWALTAGSPLAALAAAPAAPAACAPIPLAGGNAAAVATPSAADAWGGPRRGNEATLSDRVVRYSIDATLDPVKHTVTGKQQLTWRNRSAQPVCSVYLHLYLNAFEGPGSTFMTELREGNDKFRSGVDVKDGDWGYMQLRKVAQGGAPVQWRFVQPDGGPKTDRTVVRLDLPQPVAPGASTTLDIDFFDQLPRVIARTGYFGSFHLVAQWFPKVGVLELPGERGATAPRWNAHEFHAHSEFYADFGEYDVRITVPKGYTVGATGEQTGAPVEKDGKVTHRFVQGDVHDFAWTADKRYARPLVGHYNGAGSPQVTVRVLYTPEYAHNAQPALDATLQSLEFFSRTLGPYPYRTVTVVIPPHNAGEAGGMEYPTFFTASSFAKVDPGTLTRDLLDFVTIHEFGHGYFYGILASNEFEEPMLDEGLNEYWDQRMLRAAGRDIHLGTPLMKTLGIDLRLPVFDYERLGAMTEHPADPLGQNSWKRMSGGSYGTVYSRTATAMRDLEAAVGTPALERAFKLYYARWKFRHPSIADLRQALIEGTGQRATVERIFAQQVYGVQPVDDRIAAFSSNEVLPQPGYVQYRGRRIELTSAAIDKAIADKRAAWKKAHPEAKPGEGPFPYRTSVLVRRAGADVPQTVTVTFADGSRATAHFSGTRPWQRFTWTKHGKAVSVQLDPQHKVYLDASKFDDARTLENDGSVAQRLTGQFASALQTLFSFLVSL